MCCFDYLYDGIPADVSASVFLLFCCIHKLIFYASFRVDESLADGVYELVAEQEGGQ